MQTFDIIVLIGALCGFSLVIGSMLLLYKGSIQLNRACKSDDGLSIELVKEIKVTTRNPALGLFVIGLVFFVSSAYFSQQGAIEDVTLSGVIESPDEVVGVEVHLFAGPWKRDVTDDRGIVSEVYYPDIKKFNVKIIAPGYAKPEINRDVEIRSGKVVLGNIDIGERKTVHVDEKPDIPPRQPAGGTAVVAEGGY